MELRLLRYFVAVAEELHFTRAARRLNMAQPPLSQQILRLEEELGVPLLARSKRHVELTEPGRQFLASAREILAQVERAADQVRRMGRGEEGRLAIGMVTSVAFEDRWPRLLRAYRALRPAVAITIQEMGGNAQLQALREGRLQVGFLRPPAAHPGLGATPFLREPLVAVLPEEHPLAGRKRIPLAALAGDTFITIPRSLVQDAPDLVLSACARAGFTPHATQEAMGVQSVMSFVSAGFGVSLLPRTARRLTPGGVVCVALAPPAESVEISAMYRAEHGSPVLAGFLEVLRTTANRK
jgi:DNA-binding transcriptional LysR family regulator